jgi:predicted nucleotidyltransferase
MLPPAIAQDLQCFLRVLHSRYAEALVSVVLFGSWARGEERAESDIDLLVISKHFPGSRLDRHRDMFEAVKAVTKDFALKSSIIPLTPRRGQHDETLLSRHAHGACPALRSRRVFRRHLAALEDKAGRVRLEAAGR